MLAKMLAEAIAKERNLTLPGPVPRPKGPPCGVRIENLWDAAAGRTRAPVIAGWYTVSFEIVRLTGDAPAVTIRSVDQTVKTPFNKTFPLKDALAGKRAAVNMFTEYEGYGYSRSILTIEPVACEIRNILFEKSRPSMKPSVYGEGSYIDSRTPSNPGELIDCP
jgi:hypothetical protein